MFHHFFIGLLHVFKPFFTKPLIWAQKRGPFRILPVLFLPPLQDKFGLPSGGTQPRLYLPGGIPAGSCSPLRGGCDEALALCFLFFPSFPFFPFFFFPPFPFFFFSFPFFFFSFSFFFSWHVPLFFSPLS